MYGAFVSGIFHLIFLDCGLSNLWKGKVRIRGDSYTETQRSVCIGWKAILGRNNFRERKSSSHCEHH